MYKIYLMQNSKLHILFIGAHPDDADIEFGGTAIKYLQLGHAVTYLSMTNGEIGHHLLDEQALIQRRQAEAHAVEKLLGVTYRILTTPDTQLQATVEKRNELIGIIRQIKPDIIITHRSNDYHTDHRHTSLLVQDCAYLLMVPHVVKKIKALDTMPVILFHQDNFTKPYPFSPHILVDISDVINEKMAALALHESQVFEWLPFIDKTKDIIPTKKSEKIEWLKKYWGNIGNVNRFIPLLKNNTTQFIEAFEISEYGAPLDKTNKNLIPFGFFLNDV